METQFYILLSLKTTQGFVNYGQYFLGNDRDAAYGLFDQLKGSRQFTDRAVLHIDLMESVKELPVKIKSICCTLDELGANCKLIAREIFRLKNLEEMD
ncbi:hypothetical protein [Mucilaginibacter paludis]|uniref:Uncharacterized protein n=1 Tax=Mucilaginibacter paludis DSM 18603 TaxID=714943 RepID=H1Y315_9SPHI|nr:hypothetical protein [Mucilaginibacter paludis]EHQ28833.1 hypothetical protein Mucpa_4748 [Mucilaginibacter paludis DSM 18603]